MDHSVKTMPRTRGVSSLPRILFNRHRFENDELELLFQRYIFKLQHSAISSFVALFIVLTAVLAILSFALVRAPTVDSVYHSLHCLVFVVIFVFLATKSMEDVYLNYVCYSILAFSVGFVAASLPVNYGLGYQTGETGTRYAEVDGVWQVVLVVFLVYAMLPLRTWLAFTTGVGLPALHLLVSGFAGADLLGWKWQQVTATTRVRLYCYCSIQDVVTVLHEQVFCV